MTEKKLHRICDKWIKRLRLQDWHITLNIVPHVDGVGGNPYGGTTCKPAFMESKIEIRSGMGDAETELTLVHELIHIVFSGMVAPEGILDHLFEVGIEKLARTLVGAYENS